jgi:antibiotic biosynthesis monooxygenase (ABM) superfamily enzyme
MARQKRFRLVIDFNSIEDLMAWAEGTEKRPYSVKELDALQKLHERQIAFIKTYHVSAFLNKDAPEEKDLHPIAQGIRMSRLG